jgi:hypothetical protein
MKRVGLISCGGRPDVPVELLAGAAGSHLRAAVLARSARRRNGFEVTAATPSTAEGCSWSVRHITSARPRLRFRRNHEHWAWTR